MPKLKCSHMAYEARPDRIMREADYKFARSRIHRSKQRRQPIDTDWTGDESPNVYAVAEHFAEVIAARNRLKEPNLEQLFDENVQLWKRETGHASSVAKAISHASYLRVIGLSKYSRDHQLEKLLLTEMKTEPDHWFAALTAITGENPVKPEDDFDTAVQRWLDWGKSKEII